MRAKGTVYLVGAGPGAPDLLTLRAARLLSEADIVFHDALVPPEIVALATKAEKIAVGKRCGKHSTAQRFINKRLVDAAISHRVVVRLKGGDPLLFGRAQEEIAALEAAGVPYEVVPGITAALASAAAVGTSLSQRGTVRSIALATPRVGDGEDAGDWARGFVHADAGAIYMGIGEAAVVADVLRAAGKPPSLPVAIVESASMPSERVVYTTLAELPAIDAAQFAGPTLLLIGPQFIDRRAVAIDQTLVESLLRSAHG
ncbi:MAG TPA: uroporphyrinogen-III C-methyltransferase [Casimicrobiaceae bacterium]|nr:uroporphyrinogen-III C-methyltransferase [Casimicrobiaceae bacterium]